MTNTDKDVELINFFLGTKVTDNYPEIFGISFIDSNNIVKYVDSKVYKSYLEADKAKDNYISFIESNELQLAPIITKYDIPSIDKANSEKIIGKAKKNIK